MMRCLTTYLYKIRELLLPLFMIDGKASDSQCSVFFLIVIDCSWIIVRAILLGVQI